MSLEIDPPSSFLKHVLMRLALVLVGMAVFIAVVQVLRGAPLAETFSKMFLTAIVVGLFGLLAFGCAGCAEQKPTVFAFTGVGVAVVATGIFFVGFWLELQNAAVWKSFAVAALYSIALWRCARFTLANVGPLGTAIVRLTMATSLALATILSMMIVHGEATVTLIRVMNALWILCVGGHIAAPILENIHNRPPPPPPPPPPTPPPS